MKTAYILVGVPGSGKSTWIANQKWTSTCAVISTDQIVEDYARSVGKTYSEVFKDYMPTAVDIMVREVYEAKSLRLDIVWDQTSTTIASRRKKIVMLEDYYRIAIVFKTPAEEELKNRLASRPGKEIPDQVVNNMIRGFEDVTKEEGFDEIWRVT